MRNRLLGRVLATALGDLPVSTLLDEEKVEHLVCSPITAVSVRSPLTCQAPYGICQRCYGADLSTGKLVRLGTAVGIIAAQSVGEPGTQLTMRTFHSCGVANAQGDITLVLPRVEELFDARQPKQRAMLSPIEGQVSITDDNAHRRIRVFASDHGEDHVSDIARAASVLVTQGQQVSVGQALTSGDVDPHELLALFGRLATARYLVNEVQRVYRGTGVYIADLHVECIVRQMLRFERLEESGDTTLLPGEVVDRIAMESTNAHILAQGGTGALARPILLSLAAAALQTQSWLAAASFQHTSRVLTQAALAGQWDHLVGPKERLIVGRRIPTVQT